MNNFFFFFHFPYNFQGIKNSLNIQIIKGKNRGDVNYDKGNINDGKDKVFPPLTREYFLRYQTLELQNY